MNKIKDFITNLFKIIDDEKLNEKFFNDLTKMIERMINIQDLFKAGNYLPFERLAPQGPIEITPDRRNCPWKDRIIYMHFRDIEPYYYYPHLIGEMVRWGVLEKCPVEICGEVGGTMKLRVTDFGRKYYKEIIEEAKQRLKNGQYVGN